jgi:hypothetical protein
MSTPTCTTTNSTTSVGSCRHAAVVPKHSLRQHLQLDLDCRRFSNYLGVSRVLETNTRQFLRSRPRSDACPGPRTAHRGGRIAAWHQRHAWQSSSAYMPRAWPPRSALRTRTTGRSSTPRCGAEGTGGCSTQRWPTLKRAAVGRAEPVTFAAQWRIWVQVSGPPAAERRCQGGSLRALRTHARADHRPPPLRTTQRPPATGRDRGPHQHHTDRGSPSQGSTEGHLTPAAFATG